MPVSVPSLPAAQRVHFHLDRQRLREGRAVGDGGAAVQGHAGKKYSMLRAVKACVWSTRALQIPIALRRARNHPPAWRREHACRLGRLALPVTAAAAGHPAGQHGDGCAQGSVSCLSSLHSQRCVQSSSWAADTWSQPGCGTAPPTQLPLTMSRSAPPPLAATPSPPSSKSCPLLCSTPHAQPWTRAAQHGSGLRRSGTTADGWLPP